MEPFRIRGLSAPPAPASAEGRYRKVGGGLQDYSLGGVSDGGVPVQGDKGGGARLADILVGSEMPTKPGGRQRACI